MPESNKIEQRHSETQVTTSQRQLDARVRFLIFDNGMCNRGQSFFRRSQLSKLVNEMGNYMRTILNVSALEQSEIQLSDIQVLTWFWTIVLLYFNALDWTKAAFAYSVIYIHTHTHTHTHTHKANMSRLGIHSIKTGGGGVNSDCLKSKTQKQNGFKLLWHANEKHKEWT